MIEWLQSDAAYWTLGSLPGAIGLYLFLRGIIGWRTRGRPTCWRCRYDMTGAPGLACPECGYVHRNAKQFLKTRRLWKHAIFGAMLISMCVYLLGYPEIRQRRDPHRLNERWYTAVMPTTLGIHLLPYLNEDQLDLLDDRLKNSRRSSMDLNGNYDPPMSQIGDSYPGRGRVHRRWDFSNHPISLKHLLGWQRQLLAARCRAVAGDPGELAQLKASTRLRLALFWLGKTGRDPLSADALLAALHAKDEAARYLAADALGRAGSDDDRFVDGLLQALRVTQSASRREESVILHALARLKPSDPRVVAEVIAVFERDPTPFEDEDISEIMGDIGAPILPGLLWLLDDYAAAMERAVGDDYDYDHYFARGNVLEATIRLIGAPAVAPLAARLDSPSQELRYAALSMLASIGPRADGLLPRIRRMLDDPENTHLRAKIEEAIAVLENSQDDVLKPSP